MNIKMMHNLLLKVHCLFFNHVIKCARVSHFYFTNAKPLWHNHANNTTTNYNKSLPLISALSPFQCGYDIL